MQDSSLLYRNEAFRQAIFAVCPKAVAAYPEKGKADKTTILSFALQLLELSHQHKGSDDDQSLVYSDCALKLMLMQKVPVTINLRGAVQFMDQKIVD